MHKNAPKELAIIAVWAFCASIVGHGMGVPRPVMVALIAYVTFVVALVRWVDWTS